MPDISVKELSQDIRAAIEDLRASQGLVETGIVTRVGDGVAWIYGLSGCGANEMILIETASGASLEAFVLNLGEDEIGAVLLGDDQQVYFENHPMKEVIGRGLEKGFLGACLEMGMRVAK